MQALRKTKSRPRKPQKLNERALSSLITSAGIMAIIIMVIGAILNTLVPQWAKEDEQIHMEEELRAYLSLRVQINNLIEDNDVDISFAQLVKLGASGNVPIGIIPSNGKLTFNPFSSDIEEKATNLNDSLSVYGKGGGNLEYDAENYYYEDQTIVYEHGAVILSQSSGATMKANPLFTASKSNLLNDSRSYGYFDPGTKDNPYRATFNFNGRYGNLTLSYEIFDVDAASEILIKLNRNVIALGPVTGDENWTGPHTLDLPNNIINDHSLNILEFNQTSRTGTEEWGIRNVTLSGNDTYVDVTMISLIGNKEDIGGRDSHTIQAKLLAQELNSYTWPQENLTFNFTTKFPDAWSDYLNTHLNSTRANFQWSVDRAVSDYYVTTSSVPDDDGYYVVSLALKEVNRFDCTLAIVRISLG